MTPPASASGYSALPPLHPDSATRGSTSQIPAHKARVTRLRLGLAQRALRLDRRCIRFDMEKHPMVKHLKRAFLRRRTAVVITIVLRRIRWIEPVRGSGEWWPVPLWKRQ